MELGALPEDVSKQVYGIEIDSEILEKTKKLLLAEFSFVPTLINADFFDLEPPRGQQTLNNLLTAPRIPKVDVVVGNPPYIRYQSFLGKTREKALRTALEEGVKLPELTASWVPFVIHAEKFLKKDGRLAMVLPSKLLHVGYAKPFRKWLLKKFSNITIISFERRVFPSILEDTVLLLASKSGPYGVRFIEVTDKRELSGLDLESSNFLLTHPNPDEKWTKYMLPQSLGGSLAEVLNKVRERAIPLGEMGIVTIGVVTGSNEFFTLTEEEANSWGIEKEYLIPLISRAEQIPGVEVTNSDWELIKKLGQKCYLLYVTKPWDELGSGVREYLTKKGEELNVRSRYKVRIRKTWYTVPGVRSPDLFMSYMSHEVPKMASNEIVVNERKATSTNTIHQIFLKRKLEPRLLSTLFYNSLTLLSAELVGRFYGGGVLKIEPKEAEKILIPMPEEPKEILDISSKVDRLLRAKRTTDAVAIVNEVALEGELGLKPRDVEVIEEAWKRPQERRMKKSLG
ncbi:hypothetical protein APY94_01495 [Thermococcus celericrescens]|uniref:site-specific DNA-methyltransferase (adenine-specific) n=1 Tax=Thermococcus celericrescens TaxID=227598 RepID=A0A100XZF9_9EURY|nr:class I SAM-dependent methyltransferase [Thermococcus celericrescens]KUH34520.1 hypothetical protein APY94_01495 [Thermococcus celericrescens]